MACTHAFHAFTIQLIGIIGWRAGFNADIINSIQEHIIIASSTICVFSITLSTIRIAWNAQILKSLVKSLFASSNTSRVTCRKNIKLWKGRFIAIYAASICVAIPAFGWCTFDIPWIWSWFSSWIQVARISPHWKGKTSWVFRWRSS